MLPANSLVVLAIIVVLGIAMMFFGNEGFNNASSSGSGSAATLSNTVTMQAQDFYKYLEPQILKTVGDAISKNPSGSRPVSTLEPTQLPNPMPAAFGHTPTPHATFAGRQGEDYSGCKPFNKDEYIRKDSIPCWGCSIPAPY